jgi:hypothetical protein
MNRWHQLVGLLLLALAGPLLCPAVNAQTAADPLPLAAVKSPVDTFRELLGLTAEQRKQALADRPPETQQHLLTKLREYDALTPEGRELRLHATELRWWLEPLMRLPATNRVVQLKAVPADLRSLVEERLTLWDLCPPDLQQELLLKEETARLGALTVLQRQKSLASLPPERRAELEAGLARWRALTEDQRRATCKQFDRYFDLTAEEQKQVLSKYSEAERRQMEQTLRAFENLPFGKRRECVRSFEKFANLTLAERQQFLKNAERWQQMSPAERAAWRNLVNTATDWPPLPPGLSETPPLPPPGPSSPGTASAPKGR